MLIRFCRTAGTCGAFVVATRVTPGVLERRSAETTTKYTSETNRGTLMVYWCAWLFVVHVRLGQGIRWRCGVRGRRYFCWLEERYLRHGLASVASLELKVKRVCFVLSRRWLCRTHD